VSVVHPPTALLMCSVCVSSQVAELNASAFEAMDTSHTLASRGTALGGLIASLSHYEATTFDNARMLERLGAQLNPPLPQVTLLLLLILVLLLLLLLLLVRLLRILYY